MTPDDRACRRFASLTCRRQVLRNAWQVGRYRRSLKLPGAELKLQLKEISQLVPERWRSVWLKNAKKAGLGC